MTTRPVAPPAAVLQRKRQSEMYARARQTLPGGTDSNFRAWGDDTVYVERGKGGLVWDLDGNEYIDLRMGYGPVILGHADERVDAYVNERMRLGVSFSLTSEDEVQAGELVKELNPWLGKVRMTVSGTEATMHAMRVARAYTGRTKIVKFEGQYHGVHDYALISVLPNDVGELGDPDNPVGLAWGRGIPQAVAATVIPARYNEMEVLRRIFERDGADIAAIIVEPVLGNAPHDRVRGPADLRRGQDRFSVRPWRRGRVLRRHTRPGDLRQGDGQRLSCRGLRRDQRGHERPARQGQPRRHLCR